MFDWRRRRPYVTTIVTEDLDRDIYRDAAAATFNTIFFFPKFCRNIGRGGGKLYTWPQIY